MSEPVSVAELKQECHSLIEAVARRPGAIKLLLGVRGQLLLFSQYKANRDYSQRINANVQQQNRLETLDHWGD